jgi:hypothetical protein
MAIGKSKAGPFLADVGRCQIDGDPLSVWPARELLQMADVTRSLLSLTAVSGSQTTAIRSILPHPTGVHFDLHLKRLNANDCTGISLGCHN